MKIYLYLFVFDLKNLNVLIKVYVYICNYDYFKVEEFLKDKINELND